MSPKIIPVEGRECIKSPYAGIVGDIALYNVNYGKDITVDGDSYMHAFKGTRDVSADVLTGSLAASGHVLTLKTISGEKASEYRYTFRVTCEGQKLVYYFRRKVERESGAK